MAYRLPVCDGGLDGIQITVRLSAYAYQARDVVDFLEKATAAYTMC